jgi:hypothetical protein
VSPRWQVAITNAGIVALLWGIPARNDWAVGVGATLLVVEVMLSYLALRRLRTRSLGGRWTWILRIYERAHGAFVHGAILGALMGTTILHGSWWLSARVAHLHVNILGWAGLTLLATVVFFGPTMLRTGSCLARIGGPRKRCDARRTDSCLLSSASSRRVRVGPSRPRLGSRQLVDCSSTAGQSSRWACP